MARRGPDHHAASEHRAGDRVVRLLHSRLSILDLDPRSHQPLTCGAATVAFNGEIYNYLELRAELEELGVAFHTQSDTEVLLQSYLQWGEACLDRFEGMWAFALWDSRQRRLLLARDRFAEKPLYLRYDGAGLFFASEVKFIEALRGEREAVNERQILRYLAHGYKSLYKGDETFQREVREVPAGSFLAVDGAGKTELRRYWQPSYRPRPMKFEEAVAGLRELLVESVKLRLRSDVPLAFCLSGGVDSGALVSIAAKLLGAEVHAYSILDTDERYDERDNIQATVRDAGCRNTLITLRPGQDHLDKIRRLVAYHDAPVATISYYVHSLLIEAMARDGFKVVMAGTAADELVTGYYDHFLLHLYELRDHPDFALRRQEWLEYIRPFIRNPLLQDPELYSKHPGFRDHIFDESELFRLYLKDDFREVFAEERYCDSLLRNRMLNELFHETTPVILHEEDLNAMFYSVENRSPYLDRRLFEFAFAIPPEHLIRGGYGKAVLREAMAGILNDTVRLDRRKKGFNASLLSLVDFSDPAARASLLDSSPIFDYLRRDRVEQAFLMKALPNSFSKFLFSFISAKMFLEGRSSPP